MLRDTGKSSRVLLIFGQQIRCRMIINVAFFANLSHCDFHNLTMSLLGITDDKKKIIKKRP